MDLKQTIQSIIAADEAAKIACRKRFERMAIPYGSLGRLEDSLVQIAGIQRTDQISIDRKALISLCADNGIVAEGISQSGPEVSAFI